MNINRDNYEEFFILYIDNELTAVQRDAVQAFVNDNPDLKGELEMLRQTVLPSDEGVTFFNKDVLLKKEYDDSTQIVNTENCEEFFVLYSDNELKNEENALVEEFVYRHPQYQEEFELIQQIKFHPDRSVLFPDKSGLYRSESDVRVVPMFRKMRFWKMAAAAAAILMISGTVWFALENSAKNNDGSTLAVNNQSTAGDASTPQDLPAKSKQSTDASTNVIEGSSEPANKEASPESINATQQSSESVNTTPQPAASTNPATQSTALAQSTQQKNTTSAVRSKNNIEANAASATAKNVNRKAHINALTDVNHVPQIDIAQTEGKKVNRGSNIQVPQHVEQEKPNNNKQAELRIPSAKEHKTTDETMAALQAPRSSETSAVAIGPIALKEDNVFAKLTNENDEEFEQSDKKNKMRGFFRKVTRVFDKATSREPSENRKGIHIASFAIDLN